MYQAFKFIKDDGGIDLAENYPYTPEVMITYLCCNFFPSEIVYDIIFYHSLCYSLLTRVKVTTLLYFYIFLKTVYPFRKTSVKTPKNLSPPL